MSTAFGAEFEALVAAFAIEQGFLTDAADLQSNRFLSRSVVPHIRKLSSLFNRKEKEQDASLDPYWKESSNRANMRMAYFLYFMPSNLYRVASVWAELSRLGFQWKAGPRLKGVEFGAGPAAGACGIAAGEKYAPAGLPATGDWALIEQEKAMLMIGAEWAKEYFQFVDDRDWGIRTFHRTVEPKRGMLPPAAPKFNLWVMSFYLNELSDSPKDLATALIDGWEKHLEQEGVVIMVEPALRDQSRKLLELRKELIAQSEARGLDWLKILLPCLGHQACGALAVEDDWCHEEVSWWRPPYFRTIDDMAELDRKSLNFSYLVVTKSTRSREEILPALATSKVRHRLVSPSHFEGKEQEFFLCGQDGKRRARVKDKDHPLQRGDILLDAEMRGDTNATRIDRMKGRL